MREDWEDWEVWEGGRLKISDHERAGGCKLRPAFLLFS